MLSLCYENEFSFILKLELIIITKFSHFERENEGNSEMAYCSIRRGLSNPIDQSNFHCLNRTKKRT